MYNNTRTTHQLMSMTYRALQDPRAEPKADLVVSKEPVANR